LDSLSASACKRLLELECVRRARGVCAYLAMPLELQTGALLQGLLAERYRPLGDCRAVGGADSADARAVFVPKVTGGDRHDMVMLPITNGSEERDRRVPAEQVGHPRAGAARRVRDYLL